MNLQLLLDDVTRILNDDPHVTVALGEIRLGPVLSSSSSSTVHGVRRRRRQQTSTTVQVAVEGSHGREGRCEILASERGLRDVTVFFKDGRSLHVPVPGNDDDDDDGAAPPPPPPSDHGDHTVPPPPPDVIDAEIISDLDDDDDDVLQQQLQLEEEEPSPPQLQETVEHAPRKGFSLPFPWKRNV